MAQKQFIIDGGFVTNADSAITGNLEMTGNILPSADITYDLGSPTAMWKDIYVGPGSLYINGKKVLEDDSDTITFTTDTDQDLRVSTSGVGSIEMLVSGSGTIQAKGTLQMEDGKKITNSAGNAVQFGDKIDMDNNQIINVAAPTEAGHAATKTYVDTAVANVDVSSDLANLQTTLEAADTALSNTLTSAYQSADSTVASNAAADATAKANTAETNANAYTDAQITNVINGAPGALDTLNELAAALGDDANFATTITNELNSIKTQAVSGFTTFHQRGANFTDVEAAGTPTRTFTALSNAAHYDVYLNRVLLRGPEAGADAEYSVSGTTITFVSGVVSSSDNIEVRGFSASTIS